MRKRREIMSQRRKERMSKKREEGRGVTTIEATVACMFASFLPKSYLHPQDG